MSSWHKFNFIPVITVKGSDLIIVGEKKDGSKRKYKISRGKGQTPR
jgi:hypothetical protein